MNKLKPVIVPVLLIAVFGVAFVAGIKNLSSNKGGEAKDSDQGSASLTMAADTDAAFSRALKEDMVVMVKYGAEWCGPCVQMKEEAFVDGSVAELLKGVVVVDIDIDNPGADAQWLDDHQIGPIPTVEFYRADGSKIGEFIGYGGVESFKKDVQKLLAKA